MGGKILSRDLTAHPFKMAAEVSAQDLDVEELAVTSAVLAAGAHHYGMHCKDINETFMRCRMEKKDPRKCLNEGKEVQLH